MDNDRKNNKDFDQTRQDQSAESEKTRDPKTNKSENADGDQVFADNSAENGSAKLSKGDREKAEAGSESSETSAEGSDQEKPNWARELDGTFHSEEDSDTNVRKNRQSLSKGKRIIIAIGGALLILLIAAGTFAMSFYSEVQEAERVLLEDQVFEEEYSADIEAAFSERTLNIALIGFDRGWNREELGEYLFRPDMLAVFSINFDTEQVSVVRIPRDSYVPIHGTGGHYDKINHSYYYGYQRAQGEDKHEEGIKNTIHTMSNVLGGIPIHYYVSVDMYSVIELVDAMGGIYFEVEEEIIDKHWEVGRVLVPEGPQIMDGVTFLRYLQYRDDKTGQDYGRMDRQMRLLRETFIYLRQEGKITDIPKTYRIYKDYVETDLSYTQIAALAYYALELDISDPDEILSFYTLQGGGQMKDGIWYQVISDSNRREVIKEVFGVEAEPWPPIVLEDSPEYIEKQRQKELEERRKNGGREEEEKDDFEEQAELRDQEESGEETEETAQDELADEQDDSDEISSIDKERITVPDLEGKTVQEAQLLLEEVGLEVGEVSGRAYSFLDEGLIIYSIPQAGGVTTVGSKVDLTISEGPRNGDN
ncbi:MAG: LCP family protein [Bacillota bacterium]